MCSFFYTKKNGKIRKNAFLHSNLNRLEVSHFSELKQTVSIFVFSIKFCTPNFCRTLFPNSKILTIFRIKIVAHVQKTFFECPAGNASRYWWFSPNPIYRIEFGEKLENFLPVCSTNKFYTQKGARLGPVTLKWYNNIKHSSWFNTLIV